MKPSKTSWLLFTGTFTFGAASLAYSEYVKRKYQYTSADPNDLICATGLDFIYQGNYKKAVRQFGELYVKLHYENQNLNTKWSSPIARLNVLKTTMQLELILNHPNTTIAKYLFLEALSGLSEENMVLLSETCATLADILNKNKEYDEAREYLDLSLDILNPYFTLALKRKAQDLNRIHSFLNLRRFIYTFGDLLETSGENYYHLKKWFLGYHHFKQALTLLAISTEIDSEYPRQRTTFEKLDLNSNHKKGLLFYQMANGLMELGAHEEALTHCKRARELFVKKSNSVIVFFKSLFLPTCIKENEKQLHYYVKQLEKFNSILIEDLQLILNK